MEDHCSLFMSPSNHVPINYLEIIDINWLTFVSRLQDDLSEPSELSGSTDNLSENSSTKVRFVKAASI